MDQPMQPRMAGSTVGNSASDVVRQAPQAPIVGKGEVRPGGAGFLGGW